MRGRILSKEAILVLVLQAILCLIAFNKFIGHPNEVIFQDLFDGIKNLFTFQSYLQQDASAGMALVQGHAYPYGDYLFYADLTPSIAVPLRLFSLYIYDISDYGIGIYNIILILFQWVAALASYHLFSHFVKTRWLLVVLSISFTWINPQFFRLGNGHFNLSIALFILLTLLLLVQIYKSYQKAPQQYYSTHKGKLLALLGVLYWASFTHLYYLPILGVTIGFFAFFYALDLKWRQKLSWGISLQPLLLLGMVCLVGLVAVLGTIRLVDSYYTLRAVGNIAYDYDAWKLAISSLFSAREFNGVEYLFSYGEPAHYESNLYLGAFILYGFTCLMVLKLLGRQWYLSSRAMLSGLPIARILIAVAAIGFFIGIGDRYYFADNGYYYSNYLNPFMYLRKLSSQVEQFRCLARFFWPSFWIIGLVMAYFVDYYYRKHPKLGIRILAGSLALLAVLDAKDVIRVYNGVHHKNYFSYELAESQQSALTKLDLSKYQALLPIPFFHTNTEVEGMAIDGNVYYIREAQFISLRSKLPMMSVQSSRLPVSHAHSLFSIFTASQPDSMLLAHLGEQPILVLYHKLYNSSETQLNDYGWAPLNPARDVLLNGRHLPNYYQMKKVGENDTYIFYEWNPKAALPQPQISYQWDMEAPLSATIASPIDSSSPNSLSPSNTNTLSQAYARTGQQSLQIASNSIALEQVLTNVRPNSIIEMTVWRHRQAAVGAFIVKGKEYYQQLEMVVREEGDWQQIRANCFVPNDFAGDTLHLHYWNATGQPVYLDDYSIAIRNGAQ